MALGDKPKVEPTRPAAGLDAAQKSPEQVRIDAKLNQLAAKSGAVVKAKEGRAAVGVTLDGPAGASAKAPAQTPAQTPAKLAEAKSSPAKSPDAAKVEKALGGTKPAALNQALNNVSTAVEATKNHVNKLADDLIARGVLPAVMGGTAYNRDFNALSDDITTRIKMGSDTLFKNVSTLESWVNVGKENPGSDPRAIFNSQYLEGIASAISAKTMEKVAASTALKSYDSKVLVMCPEAFATKFTTTGVDVTVGPKFAAAYELANAKYEQQPRENEAAALKELEGGMVGWILKALGVEKADHVAIVRGKHPLSYFLGAVALVTGGKSFGWAQGYWTKTKMAMSNNPKTAQFVKPIETAAKAFSGFAGKVDGATKEFFSNAVAKSAADILKLAGDGSKFVEVKEGGKGMKLSENLDLRGKKLTIEIAKDQKITFPKDTGGILDAAGKAVAKTNELKAGTYIVSTEVAKDTYFSDGVKWKIAKA